MAKKHDLPALPFYFGDWRKAPEIRALDLETRMIWFEMIGYMWESTERGYLTLNGKPVITEVISRMIGVDKATMEQALQVMEQYQVFSRRNKDGAIYCRRMVRDEHIRQRQSAGGTKAMKKKYSSEANKIVSGSVITENITTDASEDLSTPLSVVASTPLSIGISPPENEIVHANEIEPVPENKSTGTNNTNTGTSLEEKKVLLEKRSLEFKTTLNEFRNEYPLETLRAFYSYWSEPNKSFTKMKYELQETWDTRRRLATWAKREKTMGPAKNEPKCNLKYLN
jgi:hypothetical protein